MIIRATDYFRVNIVYVNETKNKLECSIVLAEKDLNYNYNKYKKIILNSLKGVTVKKEGDKIKVIFNKIKILSEAPYEYIFRTSNNQNVIVHFYNNSQLEILIGDITVNIIMMNSNLERKIR